MKRLLLIVYLLASIESIMASDKVTVPPGHKVNVIKPSGDAHVAAAPSGAMVVDYGQSGSWKYTNSQFEAAQATRSASAVVILQVEMIDTLIQENELGQFIAYWKASKEKGVSAVWVLPLRASEKSSVIKLIRGIGYGVHASAPDGACFVEVHKPDGSITVGMPGPAL